MLRRYHRSIGESPCNLAIGSPAGRPPWVAARGLPWWFKWWWIVGMGARNLVIHWRELRRLARGTLTLVRHFAMITGLNARIGKGVSHGFD